MKQRNIKSIILLFLLSGIGINLFSQPPEIENKFLYKQHTYKGFTMPYRLFVPENYDKNKLYPVVLALHTSMTVGIDNEAQLTEGRVATVWADPVNQAKYPCFVVAPQKPNENYYSEIIINILDSMIKTYSIDTNRQYVTGISLGAYETWMLISRYPNRFAAAMPKSGTLESVLSFKRVPIWCAHGQADDVVRVWSSRDVIEGLERLGRKCVYTHQKYRKAINLSRATILSQINSHADLLYSELYGENHYSWWDVSYNDTLCIKWLFNQYRYLADANALVLSNFNKYVTIKGIDTIKWVSNYSNYKVELWFSPDDGTNWQEISHTEPNNESYLFNTQQFEDCAFGLIKILLKDSADNVLAYDISENFAINNSSNGKPYIRLLESLILKTASIKQDSIDFEMKIGDPENDSIHVVFSYSNDTGKNFIKIDEIRIKAGNDHYLNKYINIKKLHIMNTIIKISVSDGQYSSSDSTPYFNHPIVNIKNFVNENSNIEIYPNPSHDIFNIKLGNTPVKDATIKIFNIDGTFKFSKRILNAANAIIDLTGYSKGIYIFSIETNGMISFDKACLE